MQLVSNLRQGSAFSLNSSTVDKQWDLAEMQGCAGEGAAVAHAVAQHIAGAVLCCDDSSLPKHHCVHLLGAQPGKTAALPASHVLWAPCW